MSEKDGAKILKEVNNKTLNINDLVIPLYFGIRETRADNLFGIVVSEDKIWCNYNGDYRLKSCEHCLKVENGELGELANLEYKKLVDSYLKYRNKKLSLSKFNSSNLKPGQFFKVMPHSKNGAFHCYIYLGKYNIHLNGKAKYHPYGSYKDDMIIDYQGDITSKYLFLRYLFFSESTMNSFITMIMSKKWNIFDLMTNGNISSRYYFNGLEPVDKLPSYLELLGDISIYELNESINSFDVFINYNGTGPRVYPKTIHTYAFLSEVTFNFSRNK